jgi:hypothetical protein
MGIPRHVINAGASLVVVLLLSAAPSAQRRFEALKQDTIPEVAGLRIITIRDTLLNNTCYTLFMMEPPVAAAPAPPPIDEAQQQAVDRIREAAELHDQQVAELKLAFQSKTGLTPELARVPGLAVARNVSLADYLVRYEVERSKADAMYESVLRAEIPGSFPAATSTPGMKTGSWEDAAEATRRAITNPDPAPIRTLADPDGFNTQLASMLQHMSDAPRLSASGPVPCTPPANSEASKQASPAPKSQSPAPKAPAPKAPARR